MTEKQFVRERRYEGPSEYLGAFGLATVFIFVGILSIVFYFIHFDFISLRQWGYWMFIPAFFIMIGGITTYIRHQRLKKEVIAALDSYKSGGRIGIKSLAGDLMMAEPHLMRLLIDLRADQQIKFRVDMKTGEIIFGETFTPPAIDTNKTPITTTDTFFCPQCGKRIPAESVFCPNCGGSIQ